MLDERGVFVSTNSYECLFAGEFDYLDDHFFRGLQQATWIPLEDFIEKLRSLPQALSVATVDLNAIVNLVP